MLDIFNDARPLDYSFWEYEIVIWQIGICTFTKNINQMWGT